MEGKRSNAAAFASTTITSDDASAADQIRRCLRDARKLEEKRRNDQLPLPPKIRDELLEESFSKLRPEQGMAKELTAEEFVTLQKGLGKLIRSDMKEKMVLLQDQLSEYHSILEEVIALKSRCERLEQDKKDLVSFYRRACQDRDHKIMLLENELARSRFCSSSSDEASSVIGSGSEGRYYLHSHDQLRHYHHSQELSAPAFFPSRMPPGISNEHCHHYHHHNESARMIQPSPSSVSDPRGNSSSLSNGINIEAIRPLPFPGPLARPVYPQTNQHHQRVDFTTHTHRLGLGVGTKSHKPS